MRINIPDRSESTVVSPIHILPPANQRVCTKKIYLLVDVQLRFDQAFFCGSIPPKNRVAKCQLFYTDQIFQTNLYPKKSR